MRQYLNVLLLSFQHVFGTLLNLYPLTIALLILTSCSLCWAPRLPNVFAFMPSIEAMVLLAFHVWLYERISRAERAMLLGRLHFYYWILFVPLPVILYMNVQVGWFVFPLIALQLLIYQACLYATAWVLEGWHERIP